MALYRVKYTNRFAQAMNRYYLQGSKEYPEGKIFIDSTLAVKTADLLNETIKKFHMLGGEYKAEVYSS